MFKKSIFTVAALLLLFSLTSEAAARKSKRRTLSCGSVQSLRDADACLEFWAEKVIPEYEGANDALLVTKAKALPYITQLIEEQGGSVTKNAFKKLKDAQYVGVILQHQDEHQLYYFVLENGDDVKPVQLLHIEAVEAERNYPKTASMKNAWSLGLKPTWDLDIPVPGEEEE